ncbi:DEAD/DEAH box helicase [Conexibacter sp. SYSU D00693]|uniref:DEAD/DEAH box helicase n=1 Tax=Conexibacter sp. SYSU D00693 TaxID=2812560 RepID=UPI00196B7773|nr:DEAD/DEAH box helicase family protein [Conexibacter sp. SYSU D00693]
MAESTTVAAEAAIPDPALVQRAEAFTRERFVHEGEDPATALAPGSARRRALDAAVRELEAGAKVPSAKWRRRYALLLGLERVLSEDEPHLVDGTKLHPHQVDALSGTLVALLARAQQIDDAAPVAETAAPVLAVDDDEPEPEEDEPDVPDEPLEPELAADEDDDEEEDEPEEDPAAREAEAFDDEADPDVDEDIDEAAADDPNAHKRFWFEHATGAGKTVAAMAFVEASRTGGVLILTHRRNLVDQFLGELHDRGYGDRESPPLLDGEGHDRVDGPVTVETYQWFVRNAGRISDAYGIVICDEAHTALGDKTSAAIRAWTGPIFIGMTATGALIARHVTDLFPTQTSRFDLAQAARRGVIAPLRCIRIPPGPGVRTIAKVPLRKGEVDVEFDQEMLAELLDQTPFNLAIADLYKTRFNGVPGVVYAAGVKHAYNVAEAFRELGMNAQAVSGETPKRELAEILAAYERGDVDVLVNAQLLAEGWNSPRATVCMHLAPTASKRIYQQRVGRVTRRHPGKESGLVIDFVHPATRHDDPVVTLHSLLERDVYRGGAIVVGPVRRGRGRRIRVERRVIPVAADEDRRHEVFERELWRIAVEHLDWGEQHMWAALAGARVAPSGWRRARAMLHFDRTGELKARFLITAVERNKNSQLRVRALQEIAQSRDPDAFDRSVDVVGTWSRDERREGAKVLLQALAERRIGRRDQANAWIWRLAEYTREIHEEYAVQRWPETKRLLGLLVNSSGAAHQRNARRLIHAARKQDRRLQAALLAAAVAHSPGAETELRDARTRLARKPSALSRELLRNFPKRRSGRNRRRKKKDVGESQQVEAAVAGAVVDGEVVEGAEGSSGGDGGDQPVSKSKRRRTRRKAAAAAKAAEERAARAEASGEASGTDADGGDGAAIDEVQAATAEAAIAETDTPVDDTESATAEAAIAETDQPAPPKPKRARRTTKKAAEPVEAEAAPVETEAADASVDDDPPAKPKRTRRTTKKTVEPVEADVPPVETEAADASVDDDPPAKPKRTRRTTKKVVAAEGEPDAQLSLDTPSAEPEADAEPPKPKRTRRTTKKAAEAEPESATDEAPKPKRTTRRKPATVAAAEAVAAAAAEADAPAKPKRTRRKPVADDALDDAA